jgi:hypothetical protein
MVFMKIPLLNVNLVNTNVLLALLLPFVSLVLETELTLKKVVLAHICIMTLVKISVHHVLMLVLNVIWMVTVLSVELMPDQYLTVHV